MAEVYSQNVCEIAINATLAGKPHVNVLHFFNDEAAKSDATMARDVLNNWQDHLMGLAPSVYTLQSATWRSMDPDDTNVGTLAPDTAKATSGPNTAALMPPNVSFLVHKNTANRPRGRRDGRMFLSWVLETQADHTGAVDAGVITQWNDALALFWNGVTDDAFGAGGGSGLVVLETTPESRLPGSTPVTINSRNVTSLTIDAKVATQRDRLR